VRALKRAGFQVNRQRGSHVILVHPETDRSVSVPCHGARDLPPGTLSHVLDDAGLTVEEFTRLLE
jgi:predicted RNA binding protein YcfA (HicA-like mRNA interferase family)